MDNATKWTMAFVLVFFGAPGVMAQAPSADELAEWDRPVDSPGGVDWRLELLAGRGYEKNVRPAPPTSLPASPPPMPLPGPPPPVPPAVTSPGNDHFNTVQLASTWHYRSPEPPTGVMLDWPTRIQARLTRYDTYASSNLDEFTIDTMPGWLYGNNETSLFAHVMKTRLDGEEFIQEYSLRLLQTKTLWSPYGFAFGMDHWEQKFDQEFIALKKDHRRNRLLAGVVGRFPHHSRFAFLAAAGRDEGLLERDDYDVRGLELNLHAGVTDKLIMMLMAEYEEGDSVQTSGNSLHRRKVDLRARYRISPVWMFELGYKYDGYEAGDFSLPSSERYDVTFGLAI